MSIPRANNIGLDVAERICGDHGFEMVRDKRGLGGFLHRVDPQHAVVLNLSPWHKTAGGGERVHVTFGVVRTDINLTQQVIFGNATGVDYPTAREKVRFLERPEARWLFDSDRAEVHEWIDTWVPLIVRETASLRFIESYWELPLGDSYTPAQLQGIRLERAWPQITNQLLWGWTDEAEDKLVAPLLADVAHLDAHHDHRREIESMIGDARHWAAEHPDGVERAFVD